MKRITSRQNAIIARYRNAARGDDRSVLLLDGPHLINEALAARLALHHVMVASDALGRPEIAALVDRLDEQGIEIASATASVIAAASPVRSPSGIVAIGERPAGHEERLYVHACPFVIVGCGLQDPGNVGAIVRVAEAGGASGFVAAGSCADPFGWKALRGSMGSALRLPIDLKALAEDAVADARHHHCRIAAAVPRGGTSLFETDLTGPLAILVGAEGPGLSQSLIDGANFRVTVPMQAPVESMNASITAALIIYEALRQRQLKS
jgi:TrmH family RNA methyltransferase